MPFKTGDRIRETSTTTGTGTLTLGGAVAGFAPFSAVCANGDTCYYCITDNASLWEVGVRAMVEAAIGAADQDVKDMWEFSTEIHSNNPVLVQFATAMGLDIGAVFTLAATL